MNIYTRLKLYTVMVVIIGAVFIIVGVYDLFNLQDWASEGYRSKDAMKSLSFWLVFCGVLFMGYFITFLQIPKKQLNDLVLAKKKENQFLLGILGALTACLISILLEH